MLCTYLRYSDVSVTVTGADVSVKVIEYDLWVLAK
jgi:hypothetical protein